MSGFAENDYVRTKRDLSGKNPYTGEENAVPAGTGGLVIVGRPGEPTYDVEFTIWESETEWRTAILIIAAEDLEPYTETVTN